MLLLQSMELLLRLKTHSIVLCLEMARVMISGNMLGGNGLGAVNGTGAPTGGKSVISGNLTTKNGYRSL